MFDPPCQEVFINSSLRAKHENAVHLGWEPVDVCPVSGCKHSDYDPFKLRIHVEAVHKAWQAMWDTAMARCASTSQQ
jgi:hypothetical protein